MLRSILTSLALAVPLATTTAAGAERPNILLIVADDQSPFEFKFYDRSSTLEAPTLENLAAQGMVIDGAYHMGAWSGAVCTPSRHMIMSGRTVWRLPSVRPDGRVAYPAAPGAAPADLANRTLAAVFNRAGYDTMRTCKQGNSYPAANAQFTVVHEKSSRGGLVDAGGDGTGSAWHADRVIDYLSDRQASEDKDPFLIYLGFSHPHDPRFGEPELLQKYGATNHRDPNTLPVLGEGAPELPVNYLATHPFPHGHVDLRDEVAVEGVWERRDEATIRNEMGREHACSEYVDTQIARVLQRLEAMGEMDNTYIIYTSDHGIAVGRHGLVGKQNLYEHTWRVPLIVKGPGIKPGSRALGNTYLLDILATLCDLAGVDPPETNEGISFGPVLRGEQTQTRDTLYGAYSGGTKPGMRAVRKGDWKLIKYDVLDGSVRETQLFNLAENPWELIDEHRGPQPHGRNLAGDPRYADKLAEMQALLLAEMRRHGDPYRLWDQPRE